ncbi:MAG TPA: biotin/lipoyl-containing protein [Thermoanaerobaculia bacterium]|nr:biotin/lipoyl-containing protein [Thermoanaerobaculia bacterium]
MKLSSGEEVAEVLIERENALLDGRRVMFDASRRDGRLEAIRIGQDVFRIRVAREKERVFVWCAGEVREFRRAGRRAARMTEAAGGLAAPMPGRLRRIVAKAGSSVARGDVILILEAMKMEHAIRAPRAGKVEKIFHAEGDLVEAGEALAEIG